MQIKLQGAKSLQVKLRKRPKLLAAKVRPIVKKHGVALKNKTIANMYATYKTKEEGGYSTGNTARDVAKDGLTFSQAGMTATIAPHTEYFPYLEYGTRFMAARPTLKPAFAYQSVLFINQLKAVMR
ncbi:hypothetical protein [uncultured Lentilactobacillus sp.]|uniref:hypothetical protein n=1 Tax=uncultured Lentilactobacillus sp. TaxID=2805375 RepID=UPI002594F595|nr:hypothetical protein [uncultured Lentilactobacillus sp.]